MPGERGRAREREEKERKRSMIGGSNIFLINKMLTKLPRVRHVGQNRSGFGLRGIICPVLKVEGEQCLFFGFRGVLRRNG
jgi:hypothetical protein